MLARVLKLIVGVALVLAGIAMLVLPGPGLLSIAGGVALVLAQWPRGRRTLASLRLRARQRYGSPRVRRVEARIPDEVCPPAETNELEIIARAPIGPSGTPSLGPPVDADPGGPVASPQGRT